MRTDLSRVLLCGLGGVAVCLVISAFLNEERDYSAAGLIICGVIGLTFIAVGLFTRPRAVENAAMACTFSEDALNRRRLAKDGSPCLSWIHRQRNDCESVEVGRRWPR